jgi:hypothetical protein
MNELQVANNMIAIARGHKFPAKHKPKGKHKPHEGGAKTPAQKRSAMLRMIMPFLSRETGEKLAIAIVNRDTKKFEALWNTVKQEIVGKLEAQKHHAVASDGDDLRDFAFNMNWDQAEKLIQLFKWVLYRLCDKNENADPCPMEPTETYEPSSPAQGFSLEAYPQLAQLYERMLIAKAEQQ